MKKSLLAIAAVVGLGMSSVQAQFNYNFSTQNQAYTALTGATSISGSTVWDDDDFSQAIGFSYNINGVSVSNAYLMGSFANGLLSTSLTSSTFSAFMYTEADLYDRANFAGGSTPLSPISYVTTGTAPNRILKIELNNAGFYDDNANADYINLQIWMYETTNVLEFHFGSSNLTAGNLNTYFYTVAGKPFFGYIHNLDANTGNFTKAYFLTGSPTAPTLDSATTFAGITNALNSWPASGTVYRYSPKSSTPTGIANMSTLTGVAVYPTVAQNELFVSNNEKEAVSYSIISLNGAAVDMNGALSNGKNTIDISTLASGVYMIDLQSASASKRVKFVKQ